MVLSRAQNVGTSVVVARPLDNNQPLRCDPPLLALGPDQLSTEVGGASLCPLPHRLE